MLAALLFLAAQADELPTIAAGERRTGRITDDHPILFEDHNVSDTMRSRGAAYRLIVAEPGLHTIDVTSVEMDPFVVVRDLEGNRLDQDNDGGAGLNARCEFDAPAAGAYRLDVCARPIALGPYEVSVSAGPAPELTAEGSIALRRADMERRLAFLEEAYGPESAEYGYMLNLSAEMSFSLGDNEESHEKYRRALDICSLALGPTHRLTQTPLNGLAVINVSLSRYAEALRLYEQLLALRVDKYGPDDPITAQTRVNMSDVFIRTEQLERAREECERALPVLVEHFESTRWIVLCLGSLGIVASAEGDLELSEEYRRRALREARDLSGLDPRLMRTVLGHLGQVLWQRGNFEEARPLLEEAHELSLRHMGPDHMATSSAELALAQLYVRMGDLDLGLELVQRAYATLQRALDHDHPAIGTHLLSHGQVYLVRGEYELARKYLEAADEHMVKWFGEDDPDTFAVRLALASTLFRLGEYGPAERMLYETLEAQMRMLGPDHPSLGPTMSDLGFVLLELGDPESALPLFERALELDEQLYGRGNQHTVSDVKGLVETLVALDRPEEAWEVLRARRAERSERIGGVLSALTESERVAILARVSLELRRAVELAALIDRPEVHEEAYAEVLGWKGWGTRLLLAGRDKLAADVGADWMDRSRELRRTQVELAGLALDADAARTSAYDERLAELRRERNRAELELARSLGSTAGSATTPSELQSSLRDGQAVIDFLVHDHLRAWVTRADRSGVVHLDLGPADAVEELVREHLRRVQEEVVDEPGTRLREALWAPLADAVGDAELVFVSADGFLGGLPFETLRLADGRYLVEERAFVYLQDVSSLPRILAEERRAAYGSALVCGGLDFDRRAEALGEASVASHLRGSFTRTWSALPGTDAEARSIAGLYAELRGGDPLLLVGEAATEERLKRELPRHAVLHLATHGFFQPDGLPSMWVEAVDTAARGAALRAEPARLLGQHPGLLTGLVCSGVNETADGRREDGYLTAEELQGLDLSGVELVVLSACETAVGRAREGEGMIGLRRACRIAGAGAVVSSLWRVDDEATARLMNAFYANLWGRGMGRLEALRAVQLESIARRLPPSAWGAFVLSGDWR